jgi:hypothetical protein
LELFIHDLVVILMSVLFEFFFLIALLYFFGDFISFGILKFFRLALIGTPRFIHWMSLVYQFLLSLGFVRFGLGEHSLVFLDDFIQVI